MNAVVTVKSIKVFGDSKEYPAEEVTMKKFVKWATETKADLRAHPILNEQLRVLEQCITTGAMATLWACTTLQDARRTRTSSVTTAARWDTTRTNVLSRRRTRRKAVDAVVPKADAVDEAVDET